MEVSGEAQNWMKTLRVSANVTNCTRETPVKLAETDSPEVNGETGNQDCKDGNDEIKHEREPLLNHEKQI